MLYLFHCFDHHRYFSQEIGSYSNTQLFLNTDSHHLHLLWYQSVISHFNSFYLQARQLVFEASYVMVSKLQSHLNY